MCFPGSWQRCWWSLLPAGRELGEEQTGKQGPGAMPQLRGPPTHWVASGVSLHLSGPRVPNMPNFPKLRAPPTRTISEFRVSNSSPEWSSETTSRKGALEEGEGISEDVLGAEAPDTNAISALLILLHLHSPATSSFSWTRTTTLALSLACLHLQPQEWSEGSLLTPGDKPGHVWHV